MNEPSATIRRRWFQYRLRTLFILTLVLAVPLAWLAHERSKARAAARIGVAKFDLHTIRAQIELYKSQHDDRVPSSGLIELLKPTNAEGTSTRPTPYGPYLYRIPENPFNNSNLVVDTNANLPPAIVAGAVGYLYNPDTGQLWINDTTIPFVDQ